METQEQRRKVHGIYLGLCFIYDKIPQKGRVYKVGGNEFKATKLISGLPEDEDKKRLLISSEELDFSFTLEDDMLRNTFKVFYKGRPIIKNTYIGSLFDDDENFYDIKKGFQISLLSIVIEIIKKIL